MLFRTRCASKLLVASVSVALFGGAVIRYSDRDTNIGLCKNINTIIWILGGVALAFGRIESATITRAVA